ncbi:hypothetical protein ccbrp13_07770 [Ktedonobacteria bacterium brp13]|nr:hypothetical protein ccbrp13_07770 [Ktedonobacteria bacterium brp13]
MVPVAIDIERIGQVLTNYLNNAIKYSSIDKMIEVCLDVARVEKGVHVDLKLVSVNGIEVLQQIKQYCDQIDGVTQCDVIILKWLL